ncbi:MAG: hypothetical protein R2838_16695 [Caldilineaceae bacterium]
MLALDLATLTTRVLYEMPQGWDVSMINATADGRYVCASISEDLSDQSRTAARLRGLLRDGAKPAAS